MLQRVVDDGAELRAVEPLAARRATAVDGPEPEQPLGVEAVGAALEQRQRRERQPAGALRRRVRAAARAAAAPRRRLRRRQRLHLRQLGEEGELAGDRRRRLRRPARATASSASGTAEPTRTLTEPPGMPIAWSPVGRRGAEPSQHPRDRRLLVGAAAHHAGHDQPVDGAGQRDVGRRGGAPRRRRRVDAARLGVGARLAQLARRRRAP